MESSEQYLLKLKELKMLACFEAGKIVDELLSKNVGKSVTDLRRATLDFIHKHQVHEDIACVLKEKIDVFISNIKIPTQVE